MLKQTAVAVLIGIIGTGTAPQQKAQNPNCLHGASEAPAQAARRDAALDLARKIISTEKAANNQGHTYYVLSDLPGLASEVGGFKVQLSTDGLSYTFSVKDTLDACRFAYFSDQDGVIYAASPVR
jgi:hypothetical protein